MQLLRSLGTCIFISRLLEGLSSLVVSDGVKLFGFWGDRLTKTSRAFRLKVYFSGKPEDGDLS